MVHIFNCTAFSYNGRYNSEFNLKVVNASSGVQESRYGKKRSVISEKMEYNPNDFFFGVESSILEFTIQMICTGSWTERRRREVAAWLFQPTYKPFISADNPDLIYYAVCTSDPSIALGAGHMGYITVTFTCSSTTPVTKMMTHDYDLRFNTNAAMPFTFLLNHVGNDNDVQPSVSFELYIPIQKYASAGGDYPDGSDIPIISNENLSFTIRNTRNTRPTDSSGAVNGFVLASALYPTSPLRQGETIGVDMRKEVVKSTEYRFRIRNTNERWIALAHGENEIAVTGPCVLRVYTQYAILR